MLPAKEVCNSRVCALHMTEPGMAIDTVGYTFILDEFDTEV